MLLLDSQVFVWFITNSARLREVTADRIEAAQAVHVSAATVWELTIKEMLGKMELPAKWSARIHDLGFRDLPVTREHAAAISEFPELVKHDPFDRLLVAQAKCSGMTLLTADRVLLALGRPYIVDATR